MKVRLVWLVMAVLSGISAKADGPVMGWSSWNTYRVNINDSLIYSQAEALVNLGLDSVGYKYVNIDDGFFGGRDSVSHSLKFHPSRFPDGLTNLVDKIHSLGLKAGIYSDAGRNTCGNFWDNDSIAENVGLYGHEVEDCKLLFDSIGFDRIKVDFCGGDSAQNSMHLSLSPKERYERIRSVIDSLGYGDVKIGVCRWCYPGTWVDSVASDWRISAGINCSWESVKHIIRENMFLSGFSCYGHYNDMDMLEIGRGLTPEEERTHFGMWCVLNSPLLIGCDLTSIPTRSLELLKNKELIALNQDVLGEQAYPIKRIGDGSVLNGGFVLVRDLEEFNGHKRAVAFYNPTNQNIEMSVSGSELCYEGEFDVRDLFLQKNLGLMSEIRTNVEPHNTYIYVVSGDKRVLRSLYEAESAWLKDYQEISDPIAAKTPYYLTDKNRSGGMAVGNVREIRFRNVVVPHDGNYRVKLGLDAQSDVTLTLECDGESMSVPQSSADGWEEADVILPIKTGVKSISVTSSDKPIRIDYMRIEPMN